MIFRFGDSVKIKDCTALQKWRAYREVVGKITQLTNDQVSLLNNDEAITLFNNKYNINFITEMLEILSKEWDE